MLVGYSVRPVVGRTLLGQLGSLNAYANGPLCHVSPVVHLAVLPARATEPRVELLVVDLAIHAVHHALGLALRLVGNINFVDHLFALVLHHFDVAFHSRPLLVWGAATEGCVAPNGSLFGYAGSRTTGTFGAALFIGTYSLSLLVGENERAELAAGCCGRFSWAPFSSSVRLHVGAVLPPHRREISSSMVG